MDDRAQINILNEFLDDMSGELEMWIRDKAAFVVHSFLITGDRQFFIPAPQRGAHYHDRDTSVEPAYDICITPIPILRFYPREAQLVVEAIIRDELRKLNDIRDKGRSANRQQTIESPEEAG